MAAREKWGTLGGTDLVDVAEPMEHRETKGIRDNLEVVESTPPVPEVKLVMKDSRAHQALMVSRAIEERKEFEETLGQWVGKGQLEIRDHGVKKVTNDEDPKVKRESKGHQEVQGFLVQATSMGIQTSLKAREGRTVKRALVAKRESEGSQAGTQQLDQKVYRDPKQKRERWVSQGRGGKEERLELLVPQERKARKENQGSLVQMDKEDSRGTVVTQEDQDSSAYKDLRDLQDQLWTVQTLYQDPQDPRGPLGSVVHVAKMVKWVLRGQWATGAL